MPPKLRAASQSWKRCFQIASVTQPLFQFRPPVLNLLALDPLGERFFLPYQHDQLSAAGNAGIDQVAFQHHVMLRRHRNNESIRVISPFWLFNLDPIDGMAKPEAAAPLSEFSRSMQPKISCSITVP